MLAGEDRKDRRCLRILLEALCEEMRGRLVEINEPVRLHKVPAERLSRRISDLAALARGRAAAEDAELACVFVHEDLDSTDGDDYPAIHRRVQEALRAELGSAQYVLAVEEMEAWLLLFPDALSNLVASWKLPVKYRGKDTGRLADPKGVLMREVSKGGRRYRESDAPTVLERAVALALHRDPIGTNRSWTRFGSDIADCCRRHLDQRTKTR
ncbi:hypothetical protein [Spirillospora sp. NPDC048823]|uniref:hypothetical protein n=1 Tax=unclassified Spirillospora TaxID=2642701 RepID=UPI00371A9C21